MSVDTKILKELTIERQYRLTNKVDGIVKRYNRGVYGELLQVNGGPHMASFMLSGGQKIWAFSSRLRESSSDSRQGVTKCKLPLERPLPNSLRGQSCMSARGMALWGLICLWAKGISSVRNLLPSLPLLMSKCKEGWNPPTSFCTSGILMKGIAIILIKCSRQIRQLR